LFIPSYILKSRHGVFYFRWPLPKQLHPRQKAETIKLSLQTRDPRKALRLSRPMIQIGEQLNEHGITYGMRYDELRGLLTEHFRKLLDDSRAEIDTKGRLNDSDRQTYETSLAVAEQAIETDTPLALVKSDDEFLARFIGKYNVPVAEDSEQYGWLERDFKRAFRSFLKSVLDYDASMGEFDLSAPQIPAVPQTSTGHSASETKSAVTGISLDQLAQRFMRERRLGDNWVKTTIMGKEEYIGLLIELFGADRDVSTFTPQDVTIVKDTLTSLPTHRHKKQATKGKPLAEVLKIPNLPRLSVPSINKYLQTYNDLFGYAHQHGYIERNLFAGVAVKQNRHRIQKGREDFTPEQVRTILDAIVDNSIMYARKQYQKWGPLIGVYTGARLNEIAQIDLADIRQQDGIWFFDLNDEGDDKQLKTQASKRRVPIHCELIRLGLLDHVEALRKQGKQKLFHELPNSVEHGRGRNLGRWFNEKLLPTLNLKTKELVFHSLRHTVVTQLVNAHVPDPLVKALVGHSQQGVTYQNYFGGHTLQVLNDAIQKLDYSQPAQTPETAIQD